MSALSAFVAGCQTTSEPCDVLRPLRMKSATADYIIKNDPTFAVGVLSNNELGEKLNCFKARR